MMKNVIASEKYFILIIICDIYIWLNAIRIVEIDGSKHSPTI